MSRAVNAVELERRTAWLARVSQAESSAREKASILRVQDRPAAREVLLEEARADEPSASADRTASAECS